MFETEEKAAEEYNRNAIKYGRPEIINRFDHDHEYDGLQSWNSLSYDATSKTEYLSLNDRSLNLQQKCYQISVSRNHELLLLLFVKIGKAYREISTLLARIPPPFWGVPEEYSLMWEENAVNLDSIFQTIGRHLDHHNMMKKAFQVIYDSLIVLRSISMTDIKKFIKLVRNNNDIPE